MSPVDDPASGRRRSPTAVPSRTSQAVAMVRAQMVRPSSPDGDANAQARLCADMVRGPTMDLKLRAHVAARTRFIDHQVLGAIRRGIHQIVIVGAGYDDRALRFRAPGVQFFELDHPSTQADKERLLRQTAAGGAELTLAPVDLRIDDVGTVLAACGHAADRPSLFIAEGLLVYLEPEVIVALLTGLRSRCTATATAAAVTDTTTLVATLAVHPRGLGSPAVVAAANARRRNATAEPWRTILPVDEHLDLVNRSGWSMVDALDDAALGTGVTPGWSQLVVARPGPGVP